MSNAKTKSVVSRMVPGKLMLAAITLFLLLPVIGFLFLDKISGAPERVGKNIFVREGQSFQKALDMASAGDTILLEPGVLFSGSFRLPNKAGSDFITVTTRTDNIPAEGTRIDPTVYRKSLARLGPDQKGSPVLLAADGAHHFRFIGVEFLPTIGGLNNIIQIGTSEESKVSQLPHHIEFDRVIIRGSEEFGQRRGIAANGRHIRIANSHISNIKRQGDESQAIAVWSTDGPVEITNNYLEAAAIGVLFGGAGSPLKLIPSNSVVRDNHINKPVAWKNSKWVVKNMFEIKNGRNIKVTNNLMTNNWAMGQAGTAIVFTTRADNDNAVIEDIEFSGNIVRSSGNAVNVYGSEGSGGRNLKIVNNLFDDINGSKWGGAGHFMIATDWDGLVVEDNTIIQTGNITNAYGKPIRRFSFRNNIVFQNLYGFFGDGDSPGMSSIRRYFPGAVVSNNLIVGAKDGSYGKQNFYPRVLNQIGFSETKYYRLSPRSRYTKKGFRGDAIGASVGNGVGSG